MQLSDSQKQRIAGELLSKVAQRCSNRTICLVLILVSETEGIPYDVSSLALAVGMKRPTVYRLLHQMTDAGEVETYSHKNNVTRTLIKLKPKGRRIAQSTVDFVSALLGDLSQLRRKPA